MPTQDNYDNHAWCMKQLKAAQDADTDNRDKAREAAVFVSKRGGQWEDRWREVSDYQGEFDLTGPMIDQICGTISKNDFDIKALPASGDASKETAKVYDGLIRHIQSISKADQAYSRVGRASAIKGLDGVEIVQQYCDSDSFEQDLIIKRVPNWLDHVWLAPHTEQDASDCDMGWKLAGLTKEVFKERYPDRAESASLSSDRKHNDYYHRPDLVMVGTFYYRKTVTKTLVMMSNGSVYDEDSEEFQKAKDELAALGITEVARRQRKGKKVCTRLFDADGWIEKAKDTVFTDYLPLVPLYTNFDYIEDKVIYFGCVEKMMDWQRTFNYTLSREITEVALSPVGKYWGTPEQIAGHEKSIETLNTNKEPLQLFNSLPDVMQGSPPVWQGGAQVNPGLRNMSETMRIGIGMGAGKFAANMGDDPGIHSGVAIDSLRDAGDTGSNKYLEARQVMQRQVGEILVRAIPRVYTPGRQVRILDEDGTYDIEVLGEVVRDEQTGEVVTLNDLSKGSYDVICVTGPSYQNRQSETVSSLVELGKIDGSVIQMGGDVIAKNIASPGMDTIAARKRRQLFMSGQLLPEELTDEERAEMQQMQQQPKQPDAMTIAAMAEDKKAQADLVEAQTKQQKVMADYDLSLKGKQIDSYKAETERYKADIDKARAIADIGETNAKASKVLEEAKAQKIENMTPLVYKTGV